MKIYYHLIKITNKIYFHYINFFFQEIKIYFYSIKINFYSIKINFYSIKIILYLVRNIFITHCFFIQVKYIFIIWIFYWLLFWWAYLVFHLYLQKSDFYFQCVNWTAARGCGKTTKKDIRILCYESSLNTEHSNVFPFLMTCINM